MAESLAFFRGRIIPVEDAQVSIMTHALHYGTAVFEGVRGNWNSDENKIFIFRLREHYERLLRGCKMMMMDIPYSLEDLQGITVDLLQSCGYRQDLYIRPIAYKSQELVANLKLQELESDFALIIIPFGSYIDTEGAIRCATSSWRRMEDVNSPPRVKIAGNYVNSILAKTEASLAGYDEGIMLTNDGAVSEGTGENLFMVADGVINTPPLGDNILTGITRDSVMQLATKELNFTVVERRITRSELYLADEIFLTGTAAHVTPVGQIDNRDIGAGDVGPVTKAIADRYAQVIKGSDPKYRHWCTPVAVQ